jgi:predicted lipid-binding transport protein (Tim44 family)
MKSFAVLAAVLTLGLTLVAADAEAAKRLGGGKSLGMQRQMTPPAKAPDAAPSPTQAAPAAAAARAPAAAPAGRSWMGPIAGLAAGLGLAALASHLGFGEELASFLMMGLIALAVVAAIGFFLRRRAASRPGGLAGAQGLQYAGAGAGPAAAPPRNFDAAMPASGTAAPAAAGSIPADFDVAAFVRNAKVYYIRLQAANDAGNLDDIREFTTPEMFAELKMNISERGAAAQETDVLAIEGEVLEVAEEENRYVVSVRFTGQIREDRGPVESVDEIWHLVKPRSGKEGWLLAGVQQLQ